MRNKEVFYIRGVEVLAYTYREALKKAERIIQQQREIKRG